MILSTMRRTAATAIVTMVMVAGTPGMALGWEPDASDPMQVKAATQIERMLASKPDLQRYFDEAVGYAIFPGVVRVAVGFGVVYGRGLVIEADRLVGRTWQLQGNLGATLGGQMHSQIIFFRDAEILEEFKTGRFEFQGRASAVLIAIGASTDPGFKSQVAIFTRTRGGLMIELAAAVAKYGYKPIDTDLASVD